jgi:nucleoid-associated protein EbfC
MVEVLRCHIDPKLFAQGDREMLEDLVATAVSQAVAKAKELHAEVVKSITGNVAMPGLDQMMAKFLGNNPPEPS